MWKTAREIDMTIIGESERSIFKHVLLNRSAGEFSGVAGNLRDVWMATFFDTCAAAGLANRFSKTSSPEIFIKHANYLLSRNKRTICYFIDIDPEKAKRLSEYVQALGAKLSIVVLCGDYRSQEIIERILYVGDVAFIFVDPNSIELVDMPTLLSQRLPNRTTFLCSLGCNAGGIKRLDRGKEWLEQCRRFLNLVRTHHEAFLIWLENDPAQWAYLLSVAKPWAEKNERMLARLRKDWCIKWIRYGMPDFDIELEWLLLRADQWRRNRDERNQRELW